MENSDKIEILEKNNMITKVGEKYGANYFLSPFLEANIETFNEMTSNEKRGK